VPLHAPWHARIIGAQGPVGGGVLVDSRRIVTCAHVIADALGLADLAQEPSGSVTVDFPQCPETEMRTAQVMPGSWFPGRPGAGAGDLAMLEVVGGEVQSTAPAQLQYAANAAGPTFAVLGHPAGRNDGTWARVTLTGVGGPGREWVQLDAVAATGIRVEAGFSGAGLLDEDAGTVVGLVVVADRAPQNRVAWMIPVEVISGYWPHLRADLGQMPAAQRRVVTPIIFPPSADMSELAGMMLRLRGIADRPSRGLFINAMENQFPGRLVVQRQDTDLGDTTALIEACLEHPGALYELVERLRVYHTLDADEQARVAEIAAVAEALDPAPLLDVSSRNRLYRILAAMADLITSEMVRSAYRDAVGLLSSEPIVPHDVTSVIRVLESAITLPDGLPPLLGFLEGLARRLPPGPAGQLRAWVDDFVVRENTPKHLIARWRLSRMPADDGQTAYLLAEVLNFGADDERYLSRVTLLQGDRRVTPPNARVLHGGTKPLGIAEMPALFDSVLNDMWELPDVEIDELVIEFLLPLELLGLAVDQWRVEPGELAHPVSVDHHVVVRLRERAQLAKRGNGLWKAKTRLLREGKATVRWIDPNNAAATSGLYSEFHRGPRPQCLALEQPPVLGHSLGGDAISSGIRTGVPVMIWCRDAAGAQSFAAELRRHLGHSDVLEMPDLVQEMRLQSSFPAGEHITLVWDLEDEPTSLVTRYQAPA
jgi:NTP-dependent ternary conflict system VMAP-like protein/trypsin-like peptidase/effector-associated domain 2 (EAD2)-containing protein